MKPETIAKIRDLLETDVDNLKCRLLAMIESGSDVSLDWIIAEYRKAYNAHNDFDDWADEQEDYNE